MFAILRHYGLPQKLVQAIKTLYNNSTSRILYENQLSEEFKTHSGVLQGDILAPFLFIIVIDYVMRKSENENVGFLTHPREGSRKPEQRLNDLDYADDIALLESEQEKAQDQLESTIQAAGQVGLEINVEKTKQMIISPYYGPHRPLSVEGKAIEIVDDFKYLGSLVATTLKDIKTRKGQAWSAFWKLKNIWLADKIPISLKIRLFEASCLSVLLYGSETWIISQEIKKALNSFATNCYRIMLRLKRTDHIPNEQLYARVKQHSIYSKVIKRQLTWVGHMLRRDRQEPIRQYALYQPSERMGYSTQGRPITTYIKYISELLGQKGVRLTAAEIERMAQDRASWKRLVLDCSKAIT